MGGQELTGGQKTDRVEALLRSRIFSVRGRAVARIGIVSPDTDSVYRIQVWR
jgi:hypothetical protein